MPSRVEFANRGSSKPKQLVDTQDGIYSGQGTGIRTEIVITSRDVKKKQNNICDVTGSSATVDDGERNGQTYTWTE